MFISPIRTYAVELTHESTQLAHYSHLHGVGNAQYNVQLIVTVEFTVVYQQQ